MYTIQHFSSEIHFSTSSEGKLVSSIKTQEEELDTQGVFLLCEDAAAAEEEDAALKPAASL